MYVFRNTLRNATKSGTILINITDLLIALRFLFYFPTARSALVIFEI